MSGTAFVFTGLIFSDISSFKLKAIPNSHCSSSSSSFSSPLIQADNPILFVALKSHLGLENNSNKVSSSFLIKANKKLVRLVDSKGLAYSDSELIIGWKKVPLSSSHKIERKIIGPFASFESAESVSNKLRSMNICPVIANPNHWEIWLPIHVDLPKSFKAQIVEKEIKYKLQPFLQTESNQFVLSGPVNISSPEGLIWNGGIYSGPFLLRPNSYGTWTLIEKVHLENYLEGVVPYEIGSNAPQAALSAQAVLARTWALANVHRYSIDGYHLCSTTQCQVYKNPRNISKAVKNAIRKTSGLVLTFSNRPIKAFYHASNGGIMAGAEEAWIMNPIPYLTVKFDGPVDKVKADKVTIDSSILKDFLDGNRNLYGIDHKLFRWERILTAREVGDYLISSDIALDLPEEIQVLSRGSSGRVISLEIRGQHKKSKIVLEVDQIRRILRPLPSTLFIVKKLEEGVWKFIGGGFGHGAGLSQAGAIDLASQGWTTEEILSHYYPGAKYGPLPENWIAP